MFGNEPPRSSSPFITPLTDISANIFAMFLLVLILALANRQHTEGRLDESNEEFALIERAPMTAPALIQHLYERREDSSAIRIDLLEGSIRLISPDRTIDALSPKAIPGQFLSLKGDPVRLYVFSHRFYPLIIRSLRKTGRTWQEISVPEALRADSSMGWSDEFNDLLGQSVEREAFVTALARLLASEGPRTGATGRAVEDSPSLTIDPDLRSHQYRPLIGRIAEWLNRVTGTVAFILALLSIWWIERHVRN